MANMVVMLRLIFLALFATFMACQAPQDKELIGSTLVYQYDENIYYLTFDSDSTLHWEAITGDEKGLKANERYIAEWVDDQKLFITWGEESGTGVSQVLDFQIGKVYNHLLFGREPYSVIGDIEILNNN